MSLVFNPFTGTFDFVGAGGSSSGIGGTIAANQIAFGTGVDTIGGSANFTYTGSALQVATTEYVLEVNPTNFSILHSPTNAEIDMSTDGIISFTAAVGTSVTVNGDLLIDTLTGVSGGRLRTGASNLNTLLVQAYDVDGAAYKTFGTGTAGNTPSWDWSFPAGGTLTGNFTSLQVNGVPVSTGTIGGTIAITQVAFGTGADTIGGSANFTWDGTVVAFTTGKGLSFDGVAAPETIVGGDDGAGHSAIIIDNPTDNYTVLVLPSFTDIFVTTALEILSPDLLNGLQIDPGSGVSLIADTGNTITLTVGTDTSLSLGTRVDIGGLTVVTPSLTRKGEARISTDIFAGSTQLNIVHYEQFAEIDTGTTKFESTAIYGATNATQTEKEITSFGAEGHYTALNVLTDYEMFWYDAVLGGSVLRIDSVTDATRLQVGAAYRFDVVRNITSEADVIAGTTSLIDTATLAWLM